jgi:hypothetical protein
MLSSDGKADCSGDRRNNEERSTAKVKRKRKHTRYTADMPRRMYSFFRDFSDPSGAPSIQKFARSIGMTVEEVGEWRRHEDFERAWRECNEIRRDYLIDMALLRRFDPSFVKFLLSDTEEPTDASIDLRVEVIE